MSVINANPLMLGDAGYNIYRSLRFRSNASAYLNRTPASAGNQQKWTISKWMKRGKLGVFQRVFGAGTVTTNETGIDLTANDQIQVYQWISTAFTFNVTTTQVLRDPSAFYHVVVAFDTTQATASDRIKIYINGTQVTSFASTSYPSLNYSAGVNSAVIHQLGFTNGGSAPDYFDGYLAEVNFIDGQALTPSSFGETSSETGAWIPKKFGGTYGTNGFYLPFSDNTSATTLAYDKSGNGNNWTANNISTTAGATYDSMTDVPTLTSATAANYCVLNPIWKSSTASTSNANLNLSQTAALDVNQTTMGVSSGKWYWEATINSVGATPTPMIGVVKGGGLDAYTSANAYYYYGNSGQKFISGSASAYGATYTTNDVVGVALDMDAGTLTFYKNNTSQGTATTGLAGEFFPAFSNGGGPTPSWSAALNFGQRPFSYTPPTGFKALNTFNLPDPVIKKPNQYMDATTYTGDGTNKNIVNAAGFQPDLVWVKIRNQPYSNNLTDAVRGTGLRLQTDTTAAESSGGLLAFNSNGFQVNGTQGELGTNGNSYVGWQWKESATAGFDIVTYTGNATARNINHNLGVAPKFIIVKDRSNTNPWPVYHASLGVQYYTLLNATDASYNNLANYWGSTAPTSTYFSVNSYGGNNANGDNFVAYLFAEIAGFSKFGSYTGNGSADGPFVYCGFRPKYVMVKNISTGATDWITLDSSRDLYNVTTKFLKPNLSNAEGTGSGMLFLSNGFKWQNDTGTSVNQSGANFIYAAFAESPFKTSNAR